MEAQYEVKNRGRPRGFIAGFRLWPGFTAVFPFARARLFVGVPDVEVKRVKPKRSAIRRMRVDALRNLCEQEGLPSSGSRNELVKRLIETEVRK